MVPWVGLNLNPTPKAQGGALSDGVQKPKTEVQEVITVQAEEGVNLVLLNFLSLQGERQGILCAANSKTSQSISALVQHAHHLIGSLPKR